MVSPGPRTRSNSIVTPGEASLVTTEDKALTPTKFPTVYTHTSSTYTEPCNKAVSQVMSDVVVADFHRLRAKGFIFNNPMERVVTTTDETQQSVNARLSVWQCVNNYADWSQHTLLVREMQKLGTVSYDTVSNGSSKAGLLALPTSVADTAGMQNRAISAAWSNISQSDLLAITSIKEAGQTINGLIQTARKAVKVFRALKKFNVKKAAGLLYSSPRQRKRKLSSVRRQTEDIYMEARYNLRPLYYDMLGILKLTVKTDYPRETFRGEELWSVTDTDSEVYTHNGILKTNIGTEPKFKVQRVATRTLKVRAGVLTELFDENLANRLGLTALAETAWDLIPFSFIADWFFNVGDTLLAWTPKPGFRTLTSWVTTHQIDTCENVISFDSLDLGTGAPVTWYPNSTGFTKQLDIGPVKKKWEYERITRYPNPSRPLVPSININLDSLKLTDLFIILSRMVSYSR